MGKRVEHLDRALRIADVGHFLNACLLLDFLDVRNVIVESHLGKAPLPEFFIVGGELVILEAIW